MRLSKNIGCFISGRWSIKFPHMFQPWNRHLLIGNIVDMYNLLMKNMHVQMCVLNVCNHIHKKYTLFLHISYSLLLNTLNCSVANTWVQILVIVVPVGMFFTHDDVIKWKHFPRYWSLVRGFTGHRWIPHPKASDAELWCFLWCTPEVMVV